MNEIINLINKITSFGLTKSDYIDRNNKILFKQLIDLNYLFSEVSFKEYNNYAYPEIPNFDYIKIRQVVIKNFPDLGHYNLVSNITKNIGKPEFAVRDAIDDLIDIIVGLLEVKWCFENSTNDVALEQLNLSYIHWQEHSLNLQRYLLEIM